MCRGYYCPTTRLCTPVLHSRDVQGAINTEGGQQRERLVMMNTSAYVFVVQNFMSVRTISLRRFY